MDEEASFANLLASTTLPSRPSWDASSPAGGAEADPWANPFSSSSTLLSDAHSNPFASTFPTSTATSSTLPTFAAPESPREEISPYVQRLQDDAELGVGKMPDPPSVIAAREQSQSQTQAQSTSFIAPRSPFDPNPHGVYASSAFATPTALEVESNPFGSSSSSTAIATAQDPAQAPFIPPQTQQSPIATSHAPSTAAGGKKGLPSDLIDEDLMAASDPEQSLKKAFVKSKPKPRPSTPNASSTDANSSGGAESKATEKKAYVFTPGSSKKKDAIKDEKDEKDEKAVRVEGDEHKAETVVNGSESTSEQDGKTTQLNAKTVRGGHDGGVKTADDGEKTLDESVKKVEVTEPESPSTPTKKDAASAASTSPSTESKHSTPTATTRVASQSQSEPKSPAAIPLPASNLPTPTVSRVPTPLPPKSEPTDSSSVLATPSIDRVSVSPLDAPAQPADEDFGFKSLSIGGSAMSAPPVPQKESWGDKAISPPTSSSRFGGRGWGAMDEDEGDAEGDSGGLFGKGGPSVIASVRADPWGGSNDLASGGSGWGEKSMEEALASTDPSSSSRYSESTSNGLASPTRLGLETSVSSSSGAPTSPDGSSIQTPTTSPRKKLSSVPVFQITVGDPTKVGDPVRGYTVYTVKTQTTSPHYRKGSFSVLRRFSDFLWLFEVLTSNNPGVIVPPVPGKHTFGRFQDQFIETRRAALQRCLGKITSHPVLQLDPDLRLFLESDSFAYESKARRQEVQAAEKHSASLLTGWTGPKFVEHDDWFDSRKNFLDSLESQLKSLSKSIEVSSKNRLELSQSISEFAETITALSESDLGTALSTTLAHLASIAEKEKDSSEEQAKDEVVEILNLADEYVRFIGSVRGAFGGRVKAWTAWQNQEKEVTRVKAQREKLRAQGRLGDRAQSSLAEVAEAERKARDLHGTYDHLSRLTKSEFVRFERERIIEFKATLERYLDGMMERERELIGAWEGLHKEIVGLVDRSSAGTGRNGSVNGARD
ncbi:hypothetical protein I317_00088 [Kwoniella heveanensis CBS 569]|nr:hypothetical protein I317_00088 [Kwoniella heveanensis CBS 569]